MTTKVTDKGIIYPDGTEQTTAAFGSSEPIDAYTKAETDDKFYDKQEINNLLEASSGAIGMVAPFAMDSVPTGWLHCDGSAVSRDTYSLLYSKIGDTYGAGDGSTTFNLPDLQDEFIRGSSDTLPVGNKQDDEFKSHLHEFGVSKNPVYGDTGAVGAEGGQMSSRGIGGNVNNGDPNYGMKRTGGSETRPRNVAMLYCINATAEPSSGGGSGGGIEEAPEDGKQYARKDAGWTEVEATGGTPVDAYTKAETDDKFYDKQEINNLLEASSGAIVGNYKANYPNSVARDPEAGNLYLVNAMSFTNNYDEVTTLYISKTDADGTLRDLNKVAEGNVIDLESTNGSGSYTIQSFSDAGAYFEIIVDRGDCNGTLAQDDDVTARLEVEEVGGEAQPPVAFSYYQAESSGPYTGSDDWVQIDYNTPELDTHNAIGSGGFIVPKSGIYDITALVRAACEPETAMKFREVSILLEVDGKPVSLYQHNAVNHTGGIESKSANAILDLSEGQVVTAKARGVTTDNTQWKIYGANGGSASNTKLSGHMVSSITEGEVKEKEAVVARAFLRTNMTLTDGVAEKLNIEMSTALEEWKDKDFVDGKFQPKVAGYYQFNGSVCSEMGASITIASLYKNGALIANGTNVYSDGDSGEGSRRSTVNDIIYLDGDKDYVELWGFVKGKTTIIQGSQVTFLSAHLITGQSSGGGSGGGETATLESLGIPNHDKVVVTADGNVGIGETALFQNNGAIKFSTLGDSTGVPNFHIGSSGYVYRSTAVMYSAEETEAAIDKKLAIKDKLIEKLEARLSKLEKRIK